MLLQKSHANDILSFTFKCNRSLTEKEALMDNLKTNVQFFFVLCLSVSAHFLFEKKFHRKNHKNVTQHRLFSNRFQCQMHFYTCMCLGAHAFIYYKVSGSVSIINSLQWILNHINLIIRNDHHRATKIFLSHKNPWAIFCVCT